MASSMLAPDHKCKIQYPVVPSGRGGV